MPRTQHNTLKLKLEIQAWQKISPTVWVWGIQIEQYELLTPPGGSRCVLFARSKQEGNESKALKINNTGSPEGRDGRMKWPGSEGQPGEDLCLLEEREMAERGLE